MGVVTYRKNRNWAMLLLRPLYPLIRKAVDLEGATDQYENLSQFCGVDHPHTENCRRANLFETMSILDGAFHNLFWGKAKVYKRKTKDESDLEEEELLKIWDRGEPVELVPPEE
jgi:hypothetical protein